GNDTVWPTRALGHGGALKSPPLVSLTRLMSGLLPKWLSTSASETGGPPSGGGVPVAVAVLVYWPAVAMRAAVKVQVSVVSSSPFALASPPAKTALKSSARLAGVPLSSRTTTPESGTLPGFVTTYVKVTVLPTGTKGPGATLLSLPLVSLTTLIAGTLPKWLSTSVSLTGGPAPGGGVPDAVPTLVYCP